MNIRIVLWTFFWIPQIFAGITYEKGNNEPKKAPSALEKTVESVTKVTSTPDITGVNARLRVEGATFRPFNLYLSPTTTAANATAPHKKLAQEIHQIIERDLKIVHGFNFVTPAGNRNDEALMKQKGAEGISKIEFGVQGDLIKATIDHKNLITGKRTIKSFAANANGQRRLAHLLSQSIYEEFIGPEDLFLLKIAAVKRDTTGSQIVMLDFDGYGETEVTQGPWRKASPYFSPDGKSIIYTVISPQGHGIVEQEIGSKQIQFRTKKPGINLDGRVIPDNSGLLVTLSFEGNANIYRTTRTGTILSKLTNSLGLNLSPTISPDGKEFAFVSDRGGSPQIYVQPLSQGSDSKPATRLTFQGKYNQTPQFSPDGKYIAFTGRDEKKVFDVFLLERASGRISRITENQGRNQEPYFTPSGRFVVFTAEREPSSLPGQPKLGQSRPGLLKPDIFLATLNGDHQIQLTDANANGKTLGYFTPVVMPKASP